MNHKEYVNLLGKRAKEASIALRSVATLEKNKALNSMADALENNMDKILIENAIDIENGRKNGLNEGLIDRLLLNEERIKSMADALRDLAKLDDPVGEITHTIKRPNGIEIGQMRVPIGVIGIIYEARPNVTVDAAGMCLKSSNAVILKGGKEAIHSNKILASILSKAADQSNMPPYTIQLIEVTDRETATELMKLNKYLDLLIPRGGKGLIRAVVENATVPVIETGTGNCHLYIDESADFEMALKIARNGKVQRPSVCNALEGFLIHESIANEFLPELQEYIPEVELRGCEKSVHILKDIALATDEDYYTEYLDLIASVKIVKNLKEAIDHINTYGSKHSEGIITESYENARIFHREVDAACVYTNASTRFTDGGEFGFGAEIGISTQKFHVRGPMGLKQLTTTKYIISGDGQIR